MKLSTLILSPRLRTLALAITVIALVAVLWRSDDPVEPMEAEALRGEAEPDSFVVGGQYLSFGENGQLITRIKSQRIEQFESDNLTMMQQPRATLLGQATDASWEVTADKGEFLDAKNLINLTGNVQVVRQAEERGPMSLSTQALTMNNNDRTIYTSEPVEIRDTFGVTSALGMKAWIDERILELNAQVEGRYETGK